MELNQQKKLANHIFRLLKVNELVIPIGRTNKGNLGLKFTAGQEDFEIYLDAVPLSTKDMLADDNNIELKKMLEKYLFDSKDVISSSITVPTTSTTTDISFSSGELPKKKRGRPAKIK